MDPQYSAQTYPEYMESPPLAGPSTSKPPTTHSVPKKKVASRPPIVKPKRAEGLTAYTSTFVPLSYNIVRNPVGDYISRELNIDVARQVSQYRVRQEKEAQAEEIERLLAAGQEVQAPPNPLLHTLIIHPGSRNLRIGRASDFYPKEIPNCIARPVSNSSSNGSNGEPEHRVKRRKLEDGDVSMNGQGGDEAIDEVAENIGHLRSYLKEKLRVNKLNADWRDATRVLSANQKSRPESIPEHNDPYRVDWTEIAGKKYLIGTEALRVPSSSNFKVRWPILRRGFNDRDWHNRQHLLDDIALIIQDSLRTELDISMRDYGKYSVVLIVPDHGDRVYVQEMTNMMLSVLGFQAVAVHQEGYAAIFSAGLSSACVVDIGAQQTSIICVDEGLVLSESRISLAYGGDDITSALTAILQRSHFPYKELDLAKSQDWLMMDNLKVRICTLAEHLVANIPWDFYVVQEKGLTQKYMFRTYDENILAALIFFDTRMIDFANKRTIDTSASKDSGAVDDLLTSAYGAPTTAMKVCTSPLTPARRPFPTAPASANPDTDIMDVTGDVTDGVKPEASPIPFSDPAQIPSVLQPNDTTTILPPRDITPASTSRAPTPQPRAGPTVQLTDYELLRQSSQVPLDAAISASITCLATENKARNVASSILLVGGGSSLNGLGAFLTERLPPLLRARDLPINDVSIIPPPRNLNPRFVSWKGASVMCNLESMSDMWIRRDEWDAIGARALKDRYLFF